MPKLLLCLALCVLLTSIAQAQADEPMGARAAALGNATVTLPDLWALHNNVAGIAGLLRPEAGVYMENRFGIQALTTVALQAIYPTIKYGSYGISLSRFGDELYNQQVLGVGAAHKVGQFSLGAKADIWQVTVAGYGNHRAVAVSVGGQGEIIPNLLFGAYAYNLNQATLAAFEDERLATVMKAGLAYTPYPRLLLALETEKSIDHDATLKAGIEYKLLQERLSLRTGFSTLTNRATFGAGFQARQLQVAYAFGSTTRLGSSHHLSVAYRWAAPAQEPR